MQSKLKERIAEYIGREVWANRWNWSVIVDHIFDMIEEDRVVEIEKRWEMEQERGYQHEQA